jgi:hypothetical protein
LNTTDDNALASGCKKTQPNCCRGVVGTKWRDYLLIDRTYRTKKGSHFTKFHIHHFNQKVITDANESDGGVKQAQEAKYKLQQSEFRRPRVLEKFNDSVCQDGCIIIENVFLPGLDRACKLMLKSTQAMLGATNDCVPYVQAVLAKIGLSKSDTRSIIKLESESSLYEAQKVRAYPELLSKM